MSMIGKSIQPEIEALIRARDFTTLRDVLDDMLPPELAEVIAEIPREDRAVVLRLLPKQVATETFEYLGFDTQEELLHALAREEAIGIMNDMHPGDRTALLEELPGTVA